LRKNKEKNQNALEMICNYLINFKLCTKYVDIKLKDCWVDVNVYISKVVCLLVDVIVSYYIMCVID